MAPCRPGRAQLELNLLTPMGPALIATKGYASTDVEPALRRALELCREIGDTEKNSRCCRVCRYFISSEGTCR